MGRREARALTTTEHITALFTDLVGSTEIQSSLSPEDADAVRNTHFSALRQAVASCGGTEVKSLGDGLMVVFSAASSALACAVRMQQAVHRDNASGERQLGLRVGLSSGEATREGHDYFGDPVIEAARLCAKAESGQILASDLVKISAGRRSSHVFTSVGDLELKGMPEPVETLEVGWAPLLEDGTAAGRVPLPARFVYRPDVGVIGRADELATLDAARERVTSGSGRELLLIAGEPGQGKTTVVAEFARRAHDAQMTVLLGRCDEEVGAPYRPFHEALTHLVANAPESVLRSHVEAHGGELGRMVPALRQRLEDVSSSQSTDAETERYLLYAAVAGLLEAASADTPVVLVLDDLHWADRPSLQLLRHLVAHSATQRLLIVGTYRDSELSRIHSLEETLAVLHREPAGVSTIAVKGFDDTGVITFMETAAGHQLDAAGLRLAHQLSRETDGNPFFVAEMLRHLTESGVFVQDPLTRRWVVGEEGQFTIPHSVRSIIGTRVARLGEDATRILATASVIGCDFDLDLLVESTGFDVDRLLDLLEDAQRAAVVTETADVLDRYSFTHALVQHTLYEDLGLGRRARTHHQVGEAIERLHPNEPDGYAAELARHFVLAVTPADTSKAIRYATLAGEHALKALAPDDAVRSFSQALELAADTPGVAPSLRLDLLIGLGTAQRQAGIAAFRETLLQAARDAGELDDTERLVASALANSRFFFSSFGEVDSAKVEVLQTALDALPETDSPERALLLAIFCTEFEYGSSRERCLAVADEARAMARRLGDDVTLLEILGRCASATESPSRLAVQLQEVDERVALAERLDDPLNRFYAEYYGSYWAAQAGQFETSDDRLASARELAARLQQPGLAWLVTAASAVRAMSHGDSAQAEVLATSALEMGTSSGQPDAWLLYGSQLATIRYIEGRYGEVVPLIAQGAELYPGVAAYTASLAYGLVEEGDEAGARDLIDRAAAEAFVVVEDAIWFSAMAGYAAVAIELQLEDHAAVLFEKLAPFHDQVPFNSLVCHEPIAMFLGALASVGARYGDAERHFREAQELNLRGGMAFAEANTKRLWGRMLRLRGDPGDAEQSRTMLTSARDMASSRGYTAIERRATAELSKLD